MKPTSFSKTSYPIFSKFTGSPTLDTHFVDDNLRDKNSLLEDSSPELTTIRNGSDMLDNLPKNNMGRSPLDLNSPQHAGVSKTQATMFGFNKQKKLKPIGKTSDLTSPTGGFKPIDYGLSDFYLKNFLAKERLETDVRKLNSLDYANQNFLESPSVKTATYENRKFRSPLKQVSSELAQITYGQGPKQKFYEALSTSYKEIYTDKKEFMKIFDDVDVAMFCLEEVVERLKCYRFELGSLVDKVGFSFKKIMEKILELTMKISSEKDLIHEKKMEENFNGIKALENEKRALEEKNKQYKNLSDVTESEANIYKFNVKSLQNEVTMLYELLKKDYLVQDQPEKLSGHDEPVSRAHKPAHRYHVVHLR